MSIRKLLFVSAFLACAIFSAQSQVNVDINMNMKHSVDGISDFGRERRMTIHSSYGESDWDGHEDKLDYLLNDLDVYFGRETGHATYWTQYTEQDPDRPGWPNESQMAEHGLYVKGLYEEDKLRHQYAERSKNMIRGINDHCPAYPNLSWYDNFARGADGWFVEDVDAAAAWIGRYMETYYAVGEGDIGEPLPKYWEAYNEPDMNFMNPSFGMIISSIEKNWEYHKLVAKEVRDRLGDKAPLIGGMTWGQLDLYKPDGLNSRSPLSTWTQYLEADNPMIPKYENMLSGVNKTGGVEHPGVGYDTWPVAWDNKSKQWWQWDYMYQGFIDYCGADMDFYGVHMYDWPQADPAADKANTRAGGHTEAFLDMFEWYDNHLFDKKKDIVLSEFGTVNGALIDQIEDGRRDWLYLKPFNQMMMQFLERPSHVVYSMPFAPVKAVWGASFKTVQYDQDNKIINTHSDILRYQGATLMEPRGTWSGNPKEWKMDEPSEGWEWSGIIHFFELWKDVDGTRIDTKSDDIDIQVDSYVEDNKVYLIINNCIDENKSINIYKHGEGTNTLKNVEFRHLFRGDDDFTKYTVSKMTSAPAQVELKPNSTIVLVYTYESNVTIDQESAETKYMSEPLTTGKNDHGTQLCHTPAATSVSTTVNVASAPTKGEAIIRIGGFFYSSLDGGNGVRVASLKVNNNVVGTNFVQPTRGYGTGAWAGGWFGVLEIGCPVAYLKDGDNTIEFSRYGNTEFTTVMIQAFDMTADPGRTTGGSSITALKFDSSSEDVMKGESLGLAPVFTPYNASNKGLTWSSSNSSVVTVDENGVVTALKSSGSATITATSKANGSVKSSITINAVPYKASEVTAIEILQGNAITVPQNMNIALDIKFTPSNIETEPEIIWFSGDEDIVEVLAPGKVVGKTIGETTTITANVKGTAVFASIDVTVVLPDGEKVYTSNIPEELSSMTSYDVTVPVEIMGKRTVKVDFLKNDVVIGTGNTEINAKGDAEAELTVELLSAPTVGTGYEVKISLIKGTEELDIKTKEVEVVAPTAVDSVSLAKDFEMIKIATKSLIATIYPSTASDKTVTWASSAPDVVSVDVNTGKVKANSIGEADIVVTTNDGSKTDTVTITVVDFEGTLTIQAEDYDRTGGPQDAIGIYTVSGTDVSAINNVQTGDWVEFDVYVPASGVYDLKFFIGTDPAVTNSAVEFIVDGNSEGTATLTAKNGWDTFGALALGSSLELLEGARTIKVKAVGSTQWQWNMDRFELTRTGDIPGMIAVDGVSLDLTSKSVLVGSTFDLVATVSPATATNKSVNWSSADVSIASVINGKVTGEGVGTVKIYATTVDGGFKDSCTVTVNPVLVTAMSLNSDTETILKGGTFSFNAIVEPENATNKNVTWSSNNAAVTIDTDGVASAVSNGTAQIKATAQDGSGIVATATVTVTDVAKAVTGITLDISEKTVSLGDVFTLTETIAPVDATNKNVVWTSSDIDIVDVDNNGEVTVESVGTATIKVTTVDGSHEASCKVIVTQSVTGVSVVAGSSTIVMGDKAVLMATITPSSATNKEVIWSTNNDEIVDVDENGVITATGLGVAYITANTIDGDFSSFVEITVVEKENDEDDVSVDDKESSRIILYPNPANSYINIGGLEDGNYKVRIYNVMGAAMFVSEVDSGDNALDINQLSVGIYLLVIEADSEVTVLRFQKK